MRSPSKTGLHSSIFEPLYARAAEELHLQPTMPILQSDWPPQSRISSPSAASSAPPHPHTQPASTQISCPPSRSRSSSDVIDCFNDGSVGSKLLGSITKSISTPSLPACCKESARETPYQRALRLREMKLQHCAEELGSESSDGGSLSNGGHDSIFSSSRGVMGTFERSAQPPITEIMNEAHPKSEGNPTPAMVSVRSSPNLRRSSSLLSKAKERSFPPPLTHTLPRSNSSDSFSYSLRAYREGGHFLLKEVKVPCRQYFQSSRKDGRLTLRLFTMDEDYEGQYSEEGDEDCKGLQTDMEVGKHPATSDVLGEAKSLDEGTSEKIDAETIRGASYAGERRLCSGEESKKMDVGMNSSAEKGAVAEPLMRCRSTSGSLRTAAFSNDGSARSKKARINAISHTGAKTCTVSQHLLPRRHAAIHPPAISCFKLALMLHESNARRVSASFAMELRGAGASNGAAKMLFTQGAEVQPVGSCLSTTQAPGYGDLIKSKPASMVICKDMNGGKCLMENLSKMKEGNGPSSGEDKKRSRERDCSVSTDGPCTAGSCRRHPISSCLVDLQEVPSCSHSQAAALQGKLQGKEWLHALHCKEILYRNQLPGKSFMKLHCVA